jgi:hypothetical protein
VERTCIEDEKSKNPTKIMKRTDFKEQKLAVLKAIRPSEWKLAIVIDEDMEVDLEPIEEAVLAKVKDNSKKLKRRSRIPKKKYLDIIKEVTDPKAVFREVISN